MSRIDELVSRLRREIGLTSFPGAEGTARLVSHLGDRVRVREDPVIRFGYCRHWEDGSTTIWVPTGATEILAHELGHHLLTIGYSTCIEFSSVRVGQVVKQREEAIANRFARAWLLPEELCEAEEWELVQESGCSLAIVRLRLQELHRK